jgi:hypothetical protein
LRGMASRYCLIALSCLGYLAFTACASPVWSLGQRHLPSDYPAWVQAGSGAVVEPGPRALVALGVTRGIRNVPLAEHTADNRARAALMRELTVYLNRWAALCAAPSWPQGPAALVQPMLTASMPGVQSVTHWTHPDDGSVYALARLDLSHVVQQLTLMGDVPAPIKRCLTAHSDGAFDGLPRVGRPAAAPSTTKELL